MDVDWLHSIRTLLQSGKADCDRIATEELEKYRRIADRARSLEKLRQRDQDHLENRKKELERIESLVKQLIPNLDSIKQEEAELNFRLQALQADFIGSVRESEVTKRNLLELTSEVVRLEHDKENEDQNQMKKFDGMMKVYRTYIKMLGMRIEWQGPDVYKIWFSSHSIKRDQPDLVLSTLDFCNWEVLDVRGDKNLKEMLNNELVEHHSVQKILLKIRQLKLNSFATLKI